MPADAGDSPQTGVRQHEKAESAASAAGITDMFESIQLIPASSGHDMHSAQKDKAHLPNIRKETGVEYREMLFFDDEAPNIAKASSHTLDTSEQCAPQVCLHGVCHPVHPAAMDTATTYVSWQASACRLLCEEGL